MWTDDPDVWETLDDLMINAWPLLNRFLNRMQKHRSDLPDLGKGVLFGVLGRFSASYNEARHESNSPEHSFALAAQAMMQDPHFTLMMQDGINTAMDNKVSNMKGDF